LPFRAFLAGGTGIGVAAVLNVFVNPLVRRARSRLVAPVVASLNEEGLRVLILHVFTQHSFTVALAVGLGWAGFHAAILIAFNAAATVAAARKEHGITVTHTPGARAAQLYVFAAWQASTQVMAQLAFTLFVARTPWLALLTFSIHSSWGVLFSPVWRLPVRLRLWAWLATGVPVLCLALVAWQL
jgi:hypothetical protein